MKNVVKVSRCSACGKDHPKLIIRELKEPIWDSGRKYTHYVLCPDTKKTIFVKEEKDDGLEK